MLEGEQRACGPGQIEVQVDLISGPRDAAHVEEAIADRGAQVAVDLIAQRNAKLRHHGEVVRLESPAVGCLDEQPGIAESDVAAGVGHDVGSADRGGRMGIAQGQLGQHLQRPAVAAIRRDRADLSPVEVVVGGEVIRQHRRRAGRGAARVVG